MKNLIEMFFTFFKIGAFTFGGGYAMIPLIEREVVSSKHWIEKDEFTDIIVISQSFPGAMAVNTSIFIGYKISGVKGAIVALLGTILPSFFIILIIAAFFMKFRDYEIINKAFLGIGAAVPVLVLIAVQSLSKSVEKNTRNIIVVIASVVAISLFNVHPIIVILVSAVYGVISFRKVVE